MWKIWLPLIATGGQNPSQSTIYVIMPIKYPLSGEAHQLIKVVGENVRFARGEGRQAAEVLGFQHLNQAPEVEHTTCALHPSIKPSLSILPFCS